MKKFLKQCALILAIAVSMGAASVMAEEAAAFSDVKEGDYFYPAVAWGTEEGITDGVGDNLFDPDGEVTRAQVVTFLWRMAGRPETAAAETFSDVEQGSWYEEAVKWAVANDITLGTGEGKFSPDIICDRAMCITLLYRMIGSPIDAAAAAEPIDITEDNMQELTLEDYGTAMVQELIKMIREGDVFSDVPEGAYYELAVIWGGINGIITDENTGTLQEGVLFRSNDPCVRKEMISFMYQTKLMKDAEKAPNVYDYGAISIVIPKEYEERLYREISATADDEDGEIIKVSELASREAAEAMGEDPEGAGELFSIVRVSEDKLHEMMTGDMSGQEVFAEDQNGKYYLYCHPTDVRYYRATPEEMAEDQEEWTELNEWAYGSVRDDIISNTEGLLPVSYTNTALDIALARILYQNEKNYTVSTTEFGPLEPGDVDAKPYAERLMEGGFVYAEDAEVPDGEYVVLDFPEDGVRFDFFKSEPDIVREVHEDYETLYVRASLGVDSNADIMQEWYDALAKAAGKTE